MRIPIPDTTATYNGTNTSVEVALLAVAQCPHGHNIAYTVPDIEDLAYYNNKAAQWAQEHANSCAGEATPTEIHQTYTGPVYQDQRNVKNTNVGAWVKNTNE